MGVGDTMALPVTRTYGTVTHQPPELLLHGVLSRSVDVWAFGVMMWELFTGRRAFQGKHSSQVRLGGCQRPTMRVWIVWMQCRCHLISWVANVQSCKLSAPHAH